MQEHSRIQLQNLSRKRERVKEGNRVQKNCARLGVHAIFSVQLGSKTGPPYAIFRGFSEPRSIESSGVTVRMVGSNPIGSTNKLGTIRSDPHFLDLTRRMGLIH